MNEIFYFSKIHYFYENKCNYLTFYNLSISFSVSHFLSLEVVFFLHNCFIFPHYFLSPTCYQLYALGPCVVLEKLFYFLYKKILIYFQNIINN